MYWIIVGLNVATFLGTLKSDMISQLQLKGPNVNLIKERMQCPIVVHTTKKVRMHY